MYDSNFNWGKLKVLLFMFAVMTISLVLLGNRALEKHFENKDIMLCKSALKSGNEEWLKKCECYYQGEPIVCIQKGGF